MGTRGPVPGRPLTTGPLLRRELRERAGTAPPAANRAATGSPTFATPEPACDLPVAGPGLDQLRHGQPHLLPGSQPAAIGNLMLSA
jgi:hypothetical protein